MYLLVLPCLACAETDLCADDQQTSVTQTMDHEEHEDENDGCGSFCDCTCCVHIVSANFQSPVIIIDKPLLKNSMQIFYKNISLPSNHFGNIWQPPKMS